MKEVEKNEQKNDVSDMHEVQETKQRELAATQNKECYGNSLESMSTDGKTREDFSGKLNEFDKKNLKNETGWSDEIVDQIDNKKQAEIYKNADLHQENINGKECLVKDIDYDYVDEKTGMTNRELMAKGRSPYDAKTGERIELHHMGQNGNGSFAELCENSEHGDGNHGILHPKTEGSWRKEEGKVSQYAKEKQEHWKTRSEGDN